MDKYLNKESKYTYDIYTDADIEDQLEKIMDARGNWVRVHNQHATFIYTYVKTDMNVKKKSWKYNAYIKNIIESLDYAVTNKSALYHIFTKYDTELANKYLAKQLDIDLDNYLDVIDRKTFDETSIWIFKPVYSWGGKGIVVFESYNDFIEYMDDEMINSSSLTDKMRSRKKWVLAEYINDPLLFQKRKFHFRVPYLYFNGKGFVGQNFSIITAGSAYQQSDYQNKEIHDTHVGKSIKGLLFPRDFDKEFNPDLSKKIFNSILELFYHITKMISDSQIKCYPDSKLCYAINGADVMITSDYDIKLLEINNDAGFTGFVDKVFEGEMYTIIDKILPPINVVSDNNFFIAVECCSQNRINFRDKYVKYKSKYLALKN